MTIEVPGRDRLANCRTLTSINLACATVCLLTLVACAPDAPSTSTVIKTTTEETDNLVAQYNQAFTEHTELPLAQWLQTVDSLGTLEATLQQIEVKGTNALDFVLTLNAEELDQPPSTDHALSPLLKANPQCSKLRQPGIKNPTDNQLDLWRGTDGNPSFKHCGEQRYTQTKNDHYSLQDAHNGDPLGIRVSQECHYIHGCVRGDARHFGLRVILRNTQLYNLHWVYYLLFPSTGANRTRSSIFCWSLHHAVSPEMTSPEFQSTLLERCVAPRNEAHADQLMFNIISNFVKTLDKEVSQVVVRAEAAGFQSTPTAVDVLKEAFINAPWYALGGALRVLSQLRKLILITP